MSTELIWGIHPVTVALRAQKRKFVEVFLKRSSGSRSRVVESPQLARVKDLANELAGTESKFRIHELPAQVLTKILRQSSRRTSETAFSSDAVHQGVVARVSPLPMTHCLSLSDILGKEERAEESELWLALDRIHDPMNFGAILRSAAFFGVSRIIVPARDQCPLSPVVSKASCGAMEALPIHSILSLPSLLSEMKNAGWEIYAGSPASSSDVGTLEEVKPSGRQLLVVGNEGEGISPELHQFFTKHLSIPCRDRLDLGFASLNVSTAAAVLMHSLTRRH